MSGNTTRLRALRLVAPEADVGLRGLTQDLLIRRVDVVAVGARDATALVLTADPIRPWKNLGFMAGKTGGASLFGSRCRL
jgi:hypothetical protein